MINTANPATAFTNPQREAPKFDDEVRDVLDTVVLDDAVVTGTGVGTGGMAGADTEQLVLRNFRATTKSRTILTTAKTHRMIICAVVILI